MVMKEMYRAMQKIWYVFLMCTLGVQGWIGIAKAQFVQYNHPELKWNTIETKHFAVHYHDGAERTGRVVAKIAEEIYWPITSLYLYEPDGKVHFIIRDHDDYSNGAAYYYDNKVEVWANPMDFILRGTHNWLRNVVTHEFTHMISLGAARKMMRTMPAIYLQYMDYEPEKNPYVLRGFPNRIVSYPIAGTTIPMWLAEGVAQFQLPGLNYDFWDSHRDMILRTSVLEHNLLDNEEMTVFGDNSVRNEKVYNQGYSMVQYIVDRYGVETLRRLMHEMKAPWRFTINGALKKTIGRSEKELYREWKSFIEKMYDYRLSKIRRHLVTGELLQNKGNANIFPAWSPDGKSYAFLSNRGNNYLSKTALYLYDAKKKDVRKLKERVNSSLAWSPDGRKIAYARISKPNKHFSHFRDIYVYDLNRNKERQLTKDYRAQSPDWSPNGDDLLFVVTKDGTQNIAILNMKSKKVKQITHFKNGEQIFSPHFSYNGKVIVFSISRKDNRDLALISVDGKKMKFILADEHDARDPVFSPDGKYIYFSYDKTGVFNIYRMRTNGSHIEPLTNVLGGAFMPDLNKNGDVLCSQFQQGGYAIFNLKNPAPIAPEHTNYLAYKENVHLASATATQDIVVDAHQQTVASSDYDDTRLPNFKPHPYQQQYSRMTFLPRIMRDYGTTKLGTYFYSSDILNKYSILGGVAANSDYDLDIFGIVEYNQFRPTIYLEAYSQVLHHEEMDSLILEINPKRHVYYKDYTHFAYKYNLAEVNVGMKMYLFNELNKIRLAFIFSRYSAKVKYKIEDQEPSQSYTYFLGRNIQLTWNFTNFVETPFSDTEINPVGKRKITFRINQEFNAFIDSFKISDYGTWIEAYKNYNFTKLELDWREHIGLFAKTALDLDMHAGAIVQPVHEFFNFYAGGLLGLRGFPYYSIEGRKLLLGRAVYRFPLWRDMNMRLFHVHFDNLYAGVFYDYGNAFNEDKIDLNQFKGNYGLEIRLDLFSFYSFPTRVFFNAAYSRMQFYKKERFSDMLLRYGGEWRYYFGITFGYF